MNESLEIYISKIASKFSRLQTSELGYRFEFESLLENTFSYLDNLKIDHDPRARQGNKPDFVVNNGDIPLLFVETKDLGISLDKTEKSEQINRYFGYANLVVTDYLEFRFYRNGLMYCEPVKIAEYDIRSRVITPMPENFELLEKTLADFPKSYKEPIKSGKHLSKIMAGKARILRDNIRQFYSLEKDSNTDLIKLYETLKKLLVHDLTITSFADMYAQTLVYGLFVARFYDDSLGSFSRQEARELIPNSNPFLKHFFDHIVGSDFDKRLKYVVDELCEVFSHSNVQELMKEYFKNDLWGETHRGPDPVIHFYEDFLREYDAELKKKMGAYYTPQPVVSFIVNSVDHILKDKYKIHHGLSDTAKLANGLHKVQVLDPATGTGTFISAIIRNIYEDVVIKRRQKGLWGSYVHNELLPRIFGFELMMAPYTIAHLKLGIAFRKTNFWDFHRRLGIYLTNSLEETQQQADLFAFGLAESIAEESKEASVIKNDKPIMVVVGNPPYSGESSNKDYHGHDVYKFESTGQKLQEKNSKWINDDYVKFIRFSEKLVEKNEEGIVAMITAHGYIDNSTFRGMRYHLMKTFDEIYVLDLHGNSNKKEKSPDGSVDENVFEIMTGVSIFIGIKTKNSKNGLATVFKADLYGKQRYKFDYLNKNNISTIDWKQINPSELNFDWVERDEKLEKEYLRGFSVDKLFNVSSVGIVTSRDKLVINTNKRNLSKKIRGFFEDFNNLQPKERFKVSEFKLGRTFYDETKIKQISYRPFDIRFVYFDDAFIERSRKRVMRNLNESQQSLVLPRQVKSSGKYTHAFFSCGIVESTYVSNKTSEIGYVFPIKIVTDNNTNVWNINRKVANQFEVYSDGDLGKIVTYLYAYLNSDKYCSKYSDFLKRDFPRVPYPHNRWQFEELAKLGQELRDLHLLQSPKLDNLTTSFDSEGNNLVEKILYKNNCIYINENQYFGNVSEVVWDYYIGSYQPIQKWLKDRKGKELTSEDIEHYQKIIASLLEANKIVKAIDKILNYD